MAAPHIFDCSQNVEKAKTTTLPPWGSQPPARPLSPQKRRRAPIVVPTHEAKETTRATLPALVQSDKSVQDSSKQPSAAPAVCSFVIMTIVAFLLVTVPAVMGPSSVRHVNATSTASSCDSSINETTKVTVAPSLLQRKALTETVAARNGSVSEKVLGNCSAVPHSALMWLDDDSTLKKFSPQHDVATGSIKVSLWANLKLEEVGTTVTQPVRIDSNDASQGVRFRTGAKSEDDAEASQPWTYKLHWQKPATTFRLEWFNEDEDFIVNNGLSKMAASETESSAYKLEWFRGDEDFIVNHGHGEALEPAHLAAQPYELRWRK